MKSIDRYLASELTKRLVVVLVVVLGSLVLERLLRLFDLVSMKGGPFYMVWEMALMLIPHYLGLALPAGFFVAIFMVVSGFSANNEFDVLLSGGISPIRFAAPFAVAGVLLVFVSLGLFGYIQPYGRYSYRAIHYLVDAVPWGEHIPERTFATVDKDATVTADQVDETGSLLSGVFVHMKSADDDIAIAAAHGELIFGPQKVYYRLKLSDGVQMVTKPGGAVSAVHFDEMAVQRDFITAVEPFRARGEDVRELSISELRTAHPISSADDWTPGEAKAELHARLVRSLSLMFLPFLTIPLALAAKRRGRSAGIVAGAIVLVLYHYILQTLQGVASAGRGSVAGMWIATAVFAALSALLFVRAQRYPGQNALDPVIAAIGTATAWLAAPFKRFRKGAP